MSKYKVNRLFYFIQKYGFDLGMLLRHKEYKIQNKLRKYRNKR